MNDRELQLFLEGWFKAECFRIELKREGTNPLHVAGPGVIEQDEHCVVKFRIHIDDPSIKILFRDLNRLREVGKIIPKEDYYQFTAYSYKHPVWSAEIAGIGCDMGLGNGGLAYGRLPEMLNFFNLPSECRKDSARLWMRENIEFPETCFTETEVKRAGKMRRKNSSRDYSDFKIGEEEFELFKNAPGVTLSCTFEKGGLNENKHVRIQEAMQFALGQQFQPCILELTHGNTRVMVLRSTTFNGDQQVRQNPPLIFKSKAWTPEVYEIAKFFYAKICEHKDEEWHPASSHIFYLLQAGTAALELQCLALGVATEGIADTCHSSLADVTDGFKEEIDDALKQVNQLELSEPLGNRIRGAMNAMKESRGSDRIRAFVEQNNIDYSIFKSWQRVRNAAAHGGILETDVIEKTLNDLNNVLYLGYAMILSYIGYTGVRTNYSNNGFPDESP